MFESAHLKQTVSREIYDAQLPELRERLLDAQFRLREQKNAALVIVLSGPAASGKSQVANHLVEWLDARAMHVHALREPTSEEVERPALYRFWRRLPPKGTLAVFGRNWYTRAIAEAVYDESGAARFERRLRRIVEFERLLAAEGVYVLKLALYLDAKSQRKRLRKMLRDENEAWRVTRKDFRENEHFEQFARVTTKALRRTDTPEAPWVVLSARSRRYRDLEVCKRVLTTLERLVDAPPHAQPQAAAAGGRGGARATPNMLETLDLSERLDGDDYHRRLEELQGRLGRLSRSLEKKKRSVVVVFEGPDAAGKGGAIRRLTHGIEARDYQVIPIAAPTDEERLLPYLWRFWRHLPGHGRFTIFDRSWYGRVLVERVEGFAAPSVWKRAYSEINAFEEQLVEAGVVLVKFWIAISQDEQARRFKEREATGYKRYKITDEDWRNRARWDDYVAAACDMFDRTSTELAPWTLVPGEDKRVARIRVLETTIAALKRAL